NEADDLLATYAKETEAKGGDVTIVSSDKDLMQLNRPSVVMYDAMKDQTIGRDEVIEKFGVEPEKVVDVQSLAGDSVDNVPGVPGIGVKTAAELIKEYGDLDSLLARAGEIKQPKRREKLIEFADQARVSRELVRLKDDVPVAVPVDRLGVQDVKAESMLAFLREMEFNTLTKRVAEALKVEVPPPLERSVGSSLAREAKPPVARSGPRPNGGGEASTPAMTASGAFAEVIAFSRGAAREPAIDRSQYETVRDLDRLAAWVKEAAELGRVAFDTETTSLDPMRADLVGFSLATARGRACYVPLGHTTGSADLFGAGGLVPGQIPVREALALLKPLLEDPATLKIGQNIKYDALIMRRYGIRVAPIDDTQLISYALDGGRGAHGMDALAERHLGHVCITFSDVIAHAPGAKKGEKTFAGVPIDKATEYAAEDADVTMRLWMALKPRLVAERMTTVYETLERPLVDVIVDMERAGIKVDRTILSRLSSSFAQSIARLDEEVQTLVSAHTGGQRFNLGSPKQLGELLFDKLKLPGGKKTKTGQWETRAGLLDDLAANEELPDDARRLINTMLEWRQLSKLKSTYTDSLPDYIHPETGRIHTCYALAATTTGRLASAEPNLQNIPVRTKEGREIRTAFVADAGSKLVSADYSQIELRVLAHIADIPQLKKAFADGLDIHAMTASEMFGVPVKDMPSDVRRRAKAINFGIIYGISAFGLAAQLGISKQEAGEYITTYFKRFPGIRDYMERTKKFAHDNGFVETVFGRRVHYPEINTKNPSMRGFLERAAINAPIQGSAADIIRRAMVRMPAALAEARLDGTTMLLQVHDELIFEAKEAEAERAKEVVRRVMEKAPEPAVTFTVPIHVDAKAADNWEAAH
ncbi:MAG: DNA polymerase I, partial [Hyphomicrobiaceae bacterium]